MNLDEITQINKGCDFALLVHSCDRYELLYKGFEYFFSKHWNFDVKCTYYFATEEKKIALDRFTNIHSGKGEWSDRLKIILEEIPENFIIYLQEDMWLNKSIDATFFNQLFDRIIEYKWEQVKLHSAEDYKTKKTDMFINGFNIARLDNSSGYLMSHQITIWNKHFLISQLRNKEHPWRNERLATKRMRKLAPVIIQIDYFSENGYPENNDNQKNILRSSYSNISVNGILHKRALPYIQELIDNDDPNHNQYGLQLKYNFQNALTHDGLSKPRKIDIIKRAKSWIQEMFIPPKKNNLSS